MTQRKTRSKADPPPKSRASQQQPARIPAHLARALASTNVAALIVTPHRHRILWANTAAIQLFQCRSHNQLLQLELPALCPDSPRTTAAQLHRQLKLARKHTPRVFQSKFRRQNGDTFDAAVCVCMVRSRSAEYLCVLPQEIPNREQLRDTTGQTETVSILQQTSAGFFKKDLEGRYVFVNEWFCQLRGRKPEEILGRTPGELLALETSASAHVRQLLAQGENDHKEIIRTGRQIIREEQYIMPNGRTVYVLSIKSPVFGPDGKIAGSQGVLFDITERKLAEETLRQQNISLSAILDSLPVVIYAKDLQGRYILSNRAHQAVLGAPPETILGKTAFDFHPPELATLYQQEEQRVLRTDAASDPVEELAFNRTRGEHRWHLTVRIPLKDLAGRTIGVAGISTDITEIKRAEDARAESEAKYRFIMDQAADMVLVLDMHGRIIDANKKACAVLGLDTRELIGRTLQEVACESAQRPGPWLWSGLTPGQTVSIEQERICKDGRRLLIELNLGPVKLPTGQVILALGRDITERRRQEEERRRELETQRFRAEVIAKLAMSPHLAAGRLPELVRELTELASEALATERVGIWLFDGKNTKLVNLDTFVRSQKSHHSGDVLSPAEFTPELEAMKNVPYVAAHDALTDPRTASYVDKYLKPLGITSMLDVAIRIEGRTIGMLCIEHVGPPRKWTEDEITFACQLADQIALAMLHHERRLTEAFLRENEERFRLLIEHAADIIAVVDNKGIITYHCPSTKNVLGYGPDETLGRCVFELVHPDDIPKAVNALNDAIANPGTPVRVECRVRHKNGQWRWLQTVARSVPGHEPEGMIIFNTRDVTESKMLEEQLRQAQKMEAIGQLAGGIAHDFNNILAAIMMQTDTLAALDGLPEEALAGLKEIRTATQRAANLTRQLLLFSRKQVLQFTELELGCLVRNLAQMLRRVIGEHIRLEIKLPEHPVYVRADNAMLDQVLINLAVNARDAMPEGGILQIEVTEQNLSQSDSTYMPEAAPGTYAVIRVTDSGCGIPAEHLDKIFNPFFTTKPPGKGTGLGLATAYGIVRQHKGWITVESTPGRGTTFRIYLPATGTHSTTQSPDRGQLTLPGGTETILLVEDDPHVRKLTRAILERAGYHVLEAANGPEALQLWEKHHDSISLLFTDVVLPEGMSGRALAARLRQTNPLLRVLLTSGYSTDFAGREPELGPGEAFVPKPASQQQILQAVRRCLDSTI